VRKEFPDLKFTNPQAAGEGGKSLSCSKEQDRGSMERNTAGQRKKDSSEGGLGQSSLLKSSEGAD